MSHKIVVSILIEIETFKKLSNVELTNIHNSIKANAKVWIDESDYVSDEVQELIDNELLSMKVIIE